MTPVVGGRRCRRCCLSGPVVAWRLLVGGLASLVVIVAVPSGSAHAQQDPEFPPPPPPVTEVPSVESSTTPSGDLPLEPDFEFAYDERNHDLWRARCEAVFDNEPQTSILGAKVPSVVTKVLPSVFYEQTGGAERICPDKLRATTTVLGEAIGGDVIGRAGIPTGHYDIGYDAGAWDHWDRKIRGELTNMVFSLDKWLTGSTINLLDWAFDFELADELSSPADTIASGYHESLKGPTVSAYNIALFVTLFYFSFQLLRGRTSVAIGELVTTYLIYSVFIAFVVLVPNGFGQLVTSTTEASGNLAASIAAVTLEGQTDTSECPAPAGPDPGVGAVVCPFGKGLHSAFIERPYDLINWGTNLGSGFDEGNALADCAFARDLILQQGPHGASDEPRFIMGEADCAVLADFNHDPTAERAGLALFVMITAIVVLVLAAVTALTLIGAQLLLVGLITVMPFAVVAGLTPGSGRAVLWKWVAAIVKVVMTVAAIAVYLSLYLVTINVLLEVTAGDSWLIQGGSLILVTLTVFKVRSRLLKASERMAAHAGDRLTRARIGGNHGTGFFTAAGAGFAAGRSRHGLAHARSAHRAVHQFAGNTDTWRTNLGTRHAVRTHNRSIALAIAAGGDPTELPSIQSPPPRGFTEPRRQRSRARIARKRQRQSAHKMSTAARKRVEKILVKPSSGHGGG